MQNNNEKPQNGKNEKSDQPKKSVLVIDDNPVNLRAVKIYLGERFEVIPARSGADGFSVLKARKVDCILLDIEMPHMSGFDFLKELKNKPDKSQIPVICVTGLEATAEFICSVVEAGFKDYISKPFEPATVISKVSKELGVSEYLL